MTRLIIPALIVLLVSGPAWGDVVKLACDIIEESGTFTFGPKISVEIIKTEVGGRSITTDFHSSIGQATGLCNVRDTRDGLWAYIGSKPGACMKLEDDGTLVGHSIGETHLHVELNKYTGLLTAIQAKGGYDMRGMFGFFQYKCRKAKSLF